MQLSVRESDCNVEVDLESWRRGETASPKRVVSLIAS